MEEKTKAICAVIFIFLIFDGGFKYFLAIGRTQTCGNFDIQWATGFPEFIPYQEDCAVREEIVDFLKKEKITFVLAPHHASVITFYSRGEIIGSVYGISQKISQRDNPDNYEFDKFGILVYKDSIYDRLAQQFFFQNSITPESKSFDTLILYYPIDRKYLFPVRARFIPE